MEIRTIPQKGTYNRSGGCGQCGNTVMIQIPKGTEMKKFDIKNEKCPNCGCKGYLKIDNQ